MTSLFLMKFVVCDYDAYDVCVFVLQTILDANDYGVAVKMITGDHLLIAKETARQLEMGVNITDAATLPMLDPVTKKKPDNLSKNFGDYIYSHDGFAQVFPEHKYLIVECLREMGYKTGMTGDGRSSSVQLTFDVLFTSPFP